MFKTLLVLLVADVALFGGWLLWQQPTPDVAIIEVYLVPLLAGLNGLLGVGLLLGKRRSVAAGFGLNALFSGLVFHLLLQSWYSYYWQSTYQTYTFAKGQQRYEITLEKKGSWFTLSDVTNRPNGSTTSLLMGDYVAHQDSVLLRDLQGVKHYLIYHHTLVGFEGSTGPILLGTRE
jgi:hypothetical protein